MEIDRRSFLAGVAATVAATAVPAGPARTSPSAPLRWRIAAVRFFPDLEFEQGHRAIRRFMWISRWHFDPETYPGHALIRHEGTGLTFLIEQNAEAGNYEVYVRRVFLRSDPADLAHSHYLITGHATRRVAKECWPSFQKCGRQIFDYASNDHRSIIWQNAPSMQIDA